MIICEANLTVSKAKADSLWTGYFKLVAAVLKVPAAKQVGLGISEQAPNRQRELIPRPPSGFVIDSFLQRVQERNKLPLLASRE